MDSDKFLSRENKELLWNVLYENNIFSNIPQENVNNIQKMFEESLLTCNRINNNLMLTNKEFISGFINKIQHYKNEIEVNNNTKEQRQNIYKKEINDKFTNKKLELTHLLNPPQPKEINFSDMDDDPLDNSKIDDMLQETIRQRELDLELPNTSNNKHTWLSGENASLDTISKNIKIGEEIKSDVFNKKEFNKDIDKPIKKVAWADEKFNTNISKEDNISNSFFENLKVKKNDEVFSKDIMNELNKLDDKLNTIIELLKSKSQ